MDNLEKSFSLQNFKYLYIKSKLTDHFLFYSYCLKDLKIFHNLLIYFSLVLSDREANILSIDTFYAYYCIWKIALLLYVALFKQVLKTYWTAKFLLSMRFFTISTKNIEEAIQNDNSKRKKLKTDTIYIHKVDNAWYWMTRFSVFMYSHLLIHIIIRSVNSMSWNYLWKPTRTIHWLSEIQHNLGMRNWQTKTTNPCEYYSTCDIGYSL